MFTSGQCLRGSASGRQPLLLFPGTHAHTLGQSETRVDEPLTDSAGSGWEQSVGLFSAACALPGYRITSTLEASQP